MYIPVSFVVSACICRSEELEGVGFVLVCSHATVSCFLLVYFGDKFGWWCFVFVFFRYCTSELVGFTRSVTK